MPIWELAWFDVATQESTSVFLHMGRRNSPLSLSRSNVILLLAFGLPTALLVSQKLVFRTEVCQSNIYRVWVVCCSHKFNSTSMNAVVLRISLCDAVVELTPAESPHDQRVCCSGNMLRCEKLPHNLHILVEACQDLWCLDMFSGKRAIYHYWSLDLTISLLEIIVLLRLCHICMQYNTHLSMCDDTWLLLYCTIFPLDNRFSRIQSVECLMSTCSTFVERGSKHA